MSKGNKIITAFLCICITVALILGITFSMQNTEQMHDDKVAYAIKLEDLEKELNYHVENVNRMEVEIELNGLTIEDLTRTIVVYEKEIVELEKIVVEKEVEIVEKNNTIVEKEVEVRNLTNIITEKQQEIVEIEKTVVEYQDRIVYLEKETVVDEEQIAELSAQIEALNDTISSLNSEINSLNSELSAKENEIQSLQTRIAELESQKSVVETQIVEKEVIITEKEEIIVEKEAEIQELIINVEVLNTTIVELNIQINLLQEELDKEVPDRQHLEMLLDSGTIYSVKNEDGSYFVSSRSSNYPGLYRVSPGTFSVEKLYDKGHSYTALYKTSVGYLISSSAYHYEVLLINNDYTFNSVVCTSDNYYYFYELDNGNVICYGGGSTGCGIAVFDITTLKFTKIYDETMSYKESLVVLDNNHLLFDSQMSNRDCIILNTDTFAYQVIDLETRYYNRSIRLPNGDLIIGSVQNNLTKLLVWYNETDTLGFIEMPYSFRPFNFYLLADGNLYVGGSVGFFILDTATYTVKTTCDLLNYGDVYLELSNGDLIVSSSLTYKGAVYIKLSDYSFNYFAENYSNYVYLLELSNGNLIISNKSSCSYYYDTTSKLSYIINGTNYGTVGFHAFEMSNSNVLISNTRNVFVFDIENKSTVNLGSYQNYDTFIEDENGVTITCNTDETKVALYYAFESGLLTEITE